MEFDFDEIGYKIGAKTYKLIGSGSGRKVYDLGNGYVVKTAKNAKGYAQNSAETLISSSSNSPILAKTVAASEDYKYIIAEKAEPIRGMKPVRDHFNVKSNDGIFKNNHMQDMLKKYNFEPADFIRSTNWGVIDGAPVIVDYGLTGEIYKKYYLSERLKILALAVVFILRK